MHVLVPRFQRFRLQFKFACLQRADYRQGEHQSNSHTRER